MRLTEPVIPGQRPVTGGQDPGGRPEPGPVDSQPPLIGRVTLSRAAHGTAVRFSLSEPASVTLDIQRARGRRLEPVGAVQLTGRQGRNRATLERRMAGRVLRPGRYRLTVGALDAAGNSATAPPRTFRITRRKR